MSRVNYLVTLTNVPEGYMGSHAAGHLFIVVQAEHRIEAEKLGQNACNLMEGFWRVKDASSIE